MSGKHPSPANTLEGKTLYRMIQRCNDPTDNSFKNYGARGIKVCDDWMSGRDGKSKYQTFMEDMGPRPPDRHSIERIDNNGNYEPGNCCWATHAEQQKNRRDNRWITAAGKTMILADWIRSSGVPDWKIRRLERRGIPFEQIVRAG